MSTSLPHQQTVPDTTVLGALNQPSSWLKDIYAADRFKTSFKQPWQYHRIIVREIFISSMQKSGCKDSSFHDQHCLEGWPIALNLATAPSNSGWEPQQIDTVLNMSGL